MRATAGCSRDFAAVAQATAERPTARERLEREPGARARERLARSSGRSRAASGRALRRGEDVVQLDVEAVARCANAIFAIPSRSSNCSTSSWPASTTLSSWSNRNTSDEVTLAGHEQEPPLDVVLPAEEGALLERELPPGRRAAQSSITAACTVAARRPRPRTSAIRPAPQGVFLGCTRMVGIGPTSPGLRGRETWR